MFLQEDNDQLCLLACNRFKVNRVICGPLDEIKTNIYDSLN